MITDKLRLAILRAQIARRDFDKQAMTLCDPDLNELLATLRHALTDLDAAVVEFEQNI